MIGYAALRWPEADARAGAIAARLRAAVLAGGWCIVTDAPGWLVLAEARAASIVVRSDADGEAILIGALFDRAATEAGAAAPALLPSDALPFAALCAHLVAHAWGAYVAIASDPDPARLAIFRDPVGRLDCVTWRCGALRLVTSRPEHLLRDAPPAGLAIDWQRVAGLLRFPGSVGEALPVKGVDVVPPGTLLRLTNSQADLARLWTPVAFCRPATRVDAGTLPSLIDACIAAWGSCADRTVAELSGGLDSAIVAAGLARLAHRPVVGWFNYRATDAESDERPYARAVATRLDLPLTELVEGERAIDDALMDSIPVTLRPAVGSLSLFHDRDLAARAAALDADSLITGQGGDALFFQPATPLIAAEIGEGRRRWRDRLATALDLAAWTGQPIWSVLGAAFGGAGHRSALGLPHYRVDLVPAGLARDPDPLAWLAGADRLPPAKQLQILNLAACRAAFGASWCAARMTVLHPLMSQPLLEHVLPIAVLDLTAGKRDRALIRAAYADRLPATLLARRGKGALSAYYGRMLARSVPFLRAYLLDGRLVHAGCLDAGVIEPLLDPDLLMRRNVYTELFVALMMEHWARTWSARIAAAVAPDP